MLTFRGSSIRRGAGLAAVAPLLLLAACGSGADSPAADPVDTEAAINAAPAGSFDGDEATGTPVKIGFMVPEGGPAVDEPDARVAAVAAVDYANEHLGGIGGHPIELDICKSQEDAASATSCANQFVQNGDVGVVIADTGQGHVVAPIVTGADLAYTSYAILGSELTLPGVFAWTGGAAVQLGAMAKAALESGATSLALFVTDVGDVVAGITALAQPTFDAIGVDLNVVAIPPGTPDATSQVTAGIKDNPGAIGIIGDGTMCTSTLKGLTTAGFTGTKYVIASCVVPSVVSAVGDALDGAVDLSWTAIDGESDESKLYRAIMAKYAPDTALNNYAPAGYQSMFGFIRAVNAGLGDNEPTAANVISAIRAAKDVPLPLGAGVTMTCDGKQVPGLPAICGNATLAQTLDADGKATDLTIIQ